jgi:ribosomal protein S18 acetylase RimI-like enzyme
MKSRPGVRDAPVPSSADLLGPRIRPARLEDVEAITAIVGEAFSADPLPAWICPRHPDSLTAGLPLLIRRLYLVKGLALVAEDPATGALSGAILALPPGLALNDVGFCWELLRTTVPRLIQLGPTGLRRNGELLRRVGILDQDLGRWYVHIIAVSAAARGRGVGVTLMAEIHRRAEEAGVPVHLESTIPRNRSFYDRLGYRVDRMVSLPEGGPEVYSYVWEGGPVARDGGVG